MIESVRADKVDHAVGFTELPKLGQHFTAGQTIAVIHHQQPDVSAVQSELLAAIVLGDAPFAPGPRVVERVE